MERENKGKLNKGKRCFEVKEIKERRIDGSNIQKRRFKLKNILERDERNEEKVEVGN